MSLHRSTSRPSLRACALKPIDNLRLEWDLDYDPRGGRLGADNLYAGYSWGRTTAGIGHALLNAVDEKGSAASIIQSQQLQPFLNIGKPTGAGFNMAANGAMTLFMARCNMPEFRLFITGLLRPYLRLPAFRTRLGPR